MEVDEGIQQANDGYGVILADPPWRYQNAGCRGAAENEYSTMSINDICSMPISDVASDNCALLLWGTWPLLPEAIRVIDAWGFTYKTGLPWVKASLNPDLFDGQKWSLSYGIGFWFRGCTEPLFVATRGKVSPPENGFVGMISPNLGHSRKPSCAHEIAEALPGPYLELFARRPRAGWDVYGNQVENSIAI